MTVVLVSGASGNVGREVVRACLARGLRVRAAGRDPNRARPALTGDVEWTALDYRDPATFSAAAEGADALFLLRPPAIANVRDTLLPFVDEARRRGVRQVVFLSVAGAAKNKLLPHHAVEQHLSRGTGWTILRPGFFAQNFGDAYRRDIVEDSRVYVPAGRGRVAFVDVRDLADVAASAFASPDEHDERAYTLTGPEAIDFDTAASLLTEALGRDIRYDPAGIVGYVRHLRRRKVPWAQVGVQTVLHAGLRFGQAEHVDPTLERLLVRRPRTLREYIGDHRSLWSGNGDDPGKTVSSGSGDASEASSRERREGT
jgi:uncharacterized protein YbjT (DUF2867 family)